MECKTHNIDGFMCISEQCDLYFAYVVVDAIDRRTGEEQPLELFFQLMANQDPKDKTDIVARAKTILDKMGYAYAGMTNHFVVTKTLDAQDMYIRGVGQTVKAEDGR